VERRSPARTTAGATARLYKEQHMFTKLKSLVLVLGAAAVLVPAASADGFGITFSKKGKQSSFGFQISAGAPCEPAPPPKCSPPVVWVPGHYEFVPEPVWVDGCSQRIWCAPRYEWRQVGHGHVQKVIIEPGCWKTSFAPGHYETREVRVWREAHWQSAG
jgi:hypothetical protein